MKNLISMQSGRRLLMAYLFGVAACVGQVADDSSDISAEALAKPKPPADDSPGVGAATCAPILQENCRAKPLTDAQLKACEQSKQDRYRECLRVEACSAQFDKASAACGPKPLQTSPKRPAFDACVQKALDALNACIGAAGPGTT